jgi:hypothetical protein
MTTFQSRDDSVQLDSSGQANITFDSAIDRAFATAQSPQSGAGAGLVSVTVGAPHTDGKTVTIRCWRTEASPDSGSVLPASGERVVVSLLGTKG